MNRKQFEKIMEAVYQNADDFEANQIEHNLRRHLEE